MSRVKQGMPAVEEHELFGHKKDTAEFRAKTKKIKMVMAGRVSKLLHAQNESMAEGSSDYEESSDGESGSEESG